MASVKPSKRDRIAAQIDLYLQQVARPAQKRQEPNDRRYDREIERSLRTIKPQDLDALLNGQDDS
ncbi:hypothetical protein ASF91_01170 [Rhizobium sp. Leaf155]|nr:hypothetical protein ASF91_01170 [Rhizobium sp. Leaf155]